MENNVWKELDEIFEAEQERLFEEYLNDPSGVLMEMANLTGNNIKLENRLPFSIYYSTLDAARGRYGIRAKLLWNPSKSPEDPDGTLELHGDYTYTPGSHKYRPTQKELDLARSFFKKYKVIFAAVWEKKLVYDDVQNYFYGRISFKELLTNFMNVKEKEFYLINHCKSLSELEKVVRENHIFNMND